MLPAKCKWLHFSWATLYIQWDYQSSVGTLRFRPSNGSEPLARVYSITPRLQTSTSGPSYFLPTTTVSTTPHSIHHSPVHSLIVRLNVHSVVHNTHSPCTSHQYTHWLYDWMYTLVYTTHTVHTPLTSTLTDCTTECTLCCTQHTLHAPVTSTLTFGWFVYQSFCWQPVVQLPDRVCHAPAQ